MKNTITLLLFIVGTINYAQTNISTNDIVDAATTTCTGATHVSVYYPKKQKHYSDSMSLSNITAEALYLDAKAKGAIINGYLDVEIAFMESNNFVCQTKTFKIITPDYFELTKKEYCLMEVANFAKNRRNYDGNETMYILDSNKNYIDTGAVFTPTFTGKHYIEYVNPVAGLSYMDSVTVNPIPTISWNNSIPNRFYTQSPKDTFALSNYITHTGIKLESNSPGVIDENGQLVLKTQYVGKFHNMMEYSSVNTYGCKSSLIDTVYIHDSLSITSPVPLVLPPNSFPLSSSHSFCPVPMSITRHVFDGETTYIGNGNTFNYTNHSFLWYELRNNKLTKLNTTGVNYTYTVPNDGKSDVIHILIAAINTITLDTSLFFNEIIQTHKRPEAISLCLNHGDSSNVKINTSIIDRDMYNFYWKGGVFNKAAYNSANSVNYTNQLGNYLTGVKNIVNENINKKQKFPAFIYTKLPADSNVLNINYYTVGNQNITSNTYVGNNARLVVLDKDSIEIITKPLVDVNFTANVNSMGLIPLNSNVNHTVNNSTPGDNVNLNYFTDTTSGLNGSYTVQEPGYLHCGFKITDSYGCSSDSTLYNLFNVDMPIGVKELLNTEVSVFPNPFFDKLTIETENIDNANIRLYNIYGSLVYETNKSIAGSQTILLPSNIPKGTYILNVIGAKNGFNKTLIKN